MSDIITVQAGKNPKFELSLERIPKGLPYDYRLIVQGSAKDRMLEIVSWPENILAMWKDDGVANPYYKPIERLVNIHLSNIRSGGTFQFPTEDNKARIEQQFCVDPSFIVSDGDIRQFLKAVGKLFT